MLNKNITSIVMILTIVTLVIIVGVLNNSFQKELAKKDIEIQKALQPSQIEIDNKALWNYIETRTKLIEVINKSSITKDVVEMKIRCYRNKINDQLEINCEEKYVDYSKK